MPTRLAKKDDIVLLHISDLHFGAHDDEKVEALERVSREYRPHLVCATGDIVDTPRKANFELARTSLEKLAAHCREPKSASRAGSLFVIPGNHDSSSYLRSSKKFTRHMRMPAEFGEYIAFGDIDVCLFGFDTTCFRVSGLGNNGRFSDASRKNFSKFADRLRQKLGDQRFERSTKVALVHHHPLPTLKSSLEPMLYFDDAGIFLNQATELGIDLVLHGHQHDPIFYNLNYNTGGEGESLIVLSAGTATKAISETTRLSKVAQIHLVVFRHGTSQVRVACLKYDQTSKDFRVTRVIPTDRRVSPEYIREDRIEYRVLANGDLRQIGKRRLTAQKENVLSETKISIGVDKFSPEVTDASKLNLLVEHNGKPIGMDSLGLVLDVPHEKQFSVPLDPPVGTVPTTICWSCEWPGGWNRLLQDGLDHGFHVISEPLERLTIIVSAEEPNVLKKLEILYEYEERLSEFTTDSGHGFTVDSPVVHSPIGYSVRLGKHRKL